MRIRYAISLVIALTALPAHAQDAPPEMVKLMCSQAVVTHSEKLTAFNNKRMEATKIKGPATADTVAPYKTNADKIKKIADEIVPLGNELNEVKKSCQNICLEVKDVDAKACNTLIDVNAAMNQILEERKKTCGEAQVGVPPKACAQYAKALPGAQRAINRASAITNASRRDQKNFSDELEVEAQGLDAAFEPCRTQQVACGNLCAEVGGMKDSCEKYKDEEYRLHASSLKSSGQQMRSLACGAFGSAEPGCDMTKYMAGVRENPELMDASRPAVLSGYRTIGAADLNSAPIQLEGQGSLTPGVVINQNAPATTTGWDNTTITYGDGSTPTRTAPVLGAPRAEGVPRPMIPPAGASPGGASPGGGLAGANANMANDSTTSALQKMAANPAFGQMLASAQPVPQAAPDNSALTQAMAMMTDVCATDPTGQACTCKLEPSRCETGKAPKVNQGEEVAGGGTGATTGREAEAKARAEMAAAFRSLTQSTAVYPGEAAKVGLTDYVPDPKDPKDRKLAALGPSAGKGVGGSTGENGTLGYVRGSPAAAARAQAAARAEGRPIPTAPPVAADAPAGKEDFNRFLPRSFGLARRRIAGVQGNGEIGGKFENLFENVNRAYRNNGPQLSPTLTVEQKW